MCCALELNLNFCILFLTDHLCFYLLRSHLLDPDADSQVLHQNFDDVAVSGGSLFMTGSTCQITIETSKEDYTTINNFGSRLKDVERSGIVTLDTKGEVCSVVGWILGEGD